MDLEVVRTLHFSFVSKLSILEKNTNVSGINICGFSQHIMQLKILANHIKHQVILVHLGFFNIF